MVKLSNLEKVDTLFQPDVNGYSRFVSVDEIMNSNLTWSKNGNGRRNVYFGVQKYNWIAERGKGNKVIALKLNGFNSYSEDQSFNDPEVLEEIMDIQNNFLEAENFEQKNSSIQKLNLKISETMSNLSISFNKKEYDIANKLNIKLSYLEKLRRDFKNKL